VILRGIAKRYAVALFNAAVKMDVAEQVGEDVASFNQLLADNADFSKYMRSPQILVAAKKELIVQVIGERSSGLFINFVMLLIDKKRLGHFDEIADGYQHLYEQLRGILEVRVITAIELDADLEEKTRETLETQTGKEVRLLKTVDPSIVGGMILIVDGKIVDGSIRHKLGTMKKELGRLKVH
jgi:F-type H+-transporting ATPase subunit delta